MEAQEPIAIDEGLLSCIFCKEMAERPLLLRCLHSCCSSCADHAAAEESTQCLCCPVCEVLTDISTAKHHNGFIAVEVRKVTALRDADKCSVCRKADDKPEEPADVWCKQCQQSLCSACVADHDRMSRDHETVDLAQSSSEVLQAAAQQQCSKHRKQLDLLCFDCKKAVCADCVAGCEGSGHSAPQPLKGPEAEKFLTGARESIKQLLEQVRGKSEQLVQHRKLVEHIQSARAKDLNGLKEKKKQTFDTVEKSFKEAKIKLKDIYDKLEDSAAAVQSLAEQLHQSVKHAETYFSNVAHFAEYSDLLDQQTTFLARLDVLAKQLDSIRGVPEAEKLVEFNGTLPKDLDDVVASWMGTPKLTTDCLGRILADVISINYGPGDRDVATEQQPAPHFGPASSSFRAPVPCMDLSVTSEGHLLLAALQHGLREYSAEGRELRFWKPDRWSDKLDGNKLIDEVVVAVQSLEERRAAVGLLHSRRILLLKRSSAAEGEKWIKHREVAVLLQSPSWKLSAHGDLVAVTACRLDDLQKQEWQPGPQLQLLRLSTGQLLYSRKYEYDIHGVALTAAAVVTTSSSSVELGEGRQYVVDSYSHRGDRRWRHELSSEEEALGVCAAATGGLFYVAVRGRWSKRSNDCVKALSADSGELLRVVLSCSSPHELMRPAHLSAGRGQQATLAVVSYDAASMQWRKVSVYPEAAAAGSS